MVSCGNDAEEIVGSLWREGFVGELVEEKDVWFDVAPECALEGSVGLGSVKFFEHLGGEHTKSGVTCEAGSMDDSFGDARLAESGPSETKDVTVFCEETAVEKFFDDARI